MAGNLIINLLGNKKTHTLLETNSSHLKMDGWKMKPSFWGPAYFQVRLLLVSGRVSLPSTPFFVIPAVGLQVFFGLNECNQVKSGTDIAWWSIALASLFKTTFFGVF